VRGYGIQLGTLALGWWKLTGQRPGSSGLILMGRQLATVFFLLLLPIVYGLGRQLGLAAPAAAYATLLLALCDLNASYSHYAIPAIGYVCWSWLAVLGAVGYFRTGGWGFLFPLACGAAGALAYKLDFLPTVLGVVALGAYAWRTRQPGVALLGLLGYAVLGYVGYRILTLDNFSWEAIQLVFAGLQEMNADAISRDQHWLLNPVIYPLGLLAAIGLPVCTFALYRLGLRRIDWQSGWWLLVLFAAMEFAVRWSIDTPFIRRANIFIPLLCLAAARGLYLLRPAVRGRWLWFVAIYTGGLALVGQFNHWNDTRYRARDFLQERLAGESVRIGYTPYAYAANMPPGGSHREDWDYLVAHESFYQRFGRSFTTPFRIPDCCEEVYHCPDEAECIFFQELLFDAESALIPVATFRTFDLYPERLLYHALFGYFETFLGDTRIYRRPDARETNTGPRSSL
jgi:hypothetical protein